MMENELLLVSSPNHGGLFKITADGVALLDDTSTTGLWTNGELFYRAIQRSHFSEIVVYNNKGAYMNWIHPDITDIHDILFHENNLYVVSTSTNEVVAIDKSGMILERFQFPGDRDAWHLNCLDVWDGNLVISAFGEFPEHRQFKHNTKNNGFVMNLMTREKLITGLSQPHSPKTDGEFQYVCDSETKKLLIFKHYQLFKEVEFENYTRGLSISDRYVFVGLSSSRNIKNEKIGSKVVVLDKLSLSVVNEYTLPVDEIYDIKLLPYSYIEGFGLENPFSIINNYENKLEDIEKTVVEKEDWIQKLSDWGQKLDKEIEEKNTLIKELQEQIDTIELLRNELSAKIQESQEMEKDMLYNIKMEQQRADDYLVRISTLTQKEMDLNQILNSKGWKVLCHCYKIRDLLLINKNK